ncbi:LLM class flavin-dependent oxidoreductase [uncultured Arthrobacter sp.]|uniref:LLM class flavin-dependent oxidoreductase n=1 Tax=uncultured Arthrobacter sp. TaxID=114050 RepID=UPI0025E98574|nr:LLM class flavin-dependent oxidoreductase [uncultured Arthrobacter sp.]
MTEPSAPLPLSVLDTTITTPGMTVAEALGHSLTLARHAEDLGYTRVWYTEHHNQAGVSSAATSIVIGYVAAHTRRIRVGSGGIMLPNHPPLAIAEQFGTLESLHPGRIDLGVGRASGSSPATMRALRRDPTATAKFPGDVAELRSFLSDHSAVTGVEAIPGRGTNVPVFILGSSTDGAKTAAALGLPFVFAGHFSPAAMEEATTVYRHRFEPSPTVLRPYLIVSANLIAAHTEEAARTEYRGMLRSEGRKAAAHIGADHFSDLQMDEVLDAGLGDQLAGMFHNTALGTGPQVAQTLRTLAERSNADELLLVPQAVQPQARLRALQLTAATWNMK